MTHLVCELKDEPHSDLTPQSLAPLVREYGISRLARETGFSREGIGRAFSPKGNPRLNMLFAVIKQLRIHVCIGVVEGFPAAQKEKLNG